MITKTFVNAIRHTTATTAFTTEAGKVVFAFQLLSRFVTMQLKGRLVPTLDIRLVPTFMPYQAVIIIYNGSKSMARGTSYSTTLLRSTTFTTSIIN